MAARKSKKNDTTFLVVLLLLLLLVGWLAWKWTSLPPAPPNYGTTQGSTGTAGQTTSSYPNYTSYANNVPSTPPVISFSMPETSSPVVAGINTTTTTTTAATGTTASAQTSTVRVPRQDTTTQTTTTARMSGTTTTRRPPPSNQGATRTTASTSTSNQRTTPPVLRPPTRPTRPLGDATAQQSGAGGPLEGFAFIKGKQQDSTGRLLLYCGSDKNSYTYIYEVDPLTFNEAQPGLMYNPTKVANWRFVSSQ